ncbi:MAG: molybdenum cofactor biosynthesis protein MoaE [Bryobacterales bacterium]|nr:molybdenum cofactor biosynthesis protein MoaE [Bryobacterales bacterium]
MPVTLLFFGQLKEIAGAPELARRVPAGASTQDLFEQVSAEFPRLAALRGSVVLARNAAFVHAPEILADGDEIAFLPPVSGGSRDAEDAEAEWIETIRTPEGHFFGITHRELDGGAIARGILRSEDGAFVNFEGVVRNHSGGRRTRYLDYECYVPLAIRTMAAIGIDLASKHAVGRVAIVHRVGRMEIGETSVAVVVTSPHRKPAFDAALEGINRLKTSVPIWKKEYFEDGEVWVEGAWDDSVYPVGDVAAAGGIFD